MNDEFKPDEVNIEEPIHEVEIPKKAKKPFNKKILWGLAVLVLLAAVAGAVYWWRDKTAKDFEKTQVSEISALKATKANLEKQLADAKGETTTKTVADVVCTDKAPVAATIDNIKASITSGNTVALEGYMASSVNVILAASEAYGAQTPTQAVTDISQFITSDLNSWDYNFSLPVATLNTYKAGFYKSYFSDISVVGKAANNKVISFSFDCNGKIDTVFMASSDSLL